MKPFKKLTPFILGAVFFLSGCGGNQPTTSETITGLNDPYIVMSGDSDTHLLNADG